MSRVRQPIEKLNRQGVEHRVDELARKLGAKDRDEAFAQLDKGKYAGRREELTLRTLRALVA